MDRLEQWAKMCLQMENVAKCLSFWFHLQMEISFFLRLLFIYKLAKPNQINFSFMCDSHFF
jgi:hypothetical protein